MMMKSPSAVWFCIRLLHEYLDTGNARCRSVCDRFSAVRLSCRTVVPDYRAALPPVAESRQTVRVSMHAFAKGHQITAAFVMKKKISHRH